MKDFILPPYEHLGAPLNPKAHAETRLEIGGKKRNFVLKMRDGVIYFKEPRGQIYAIPQLFSPALADDSIGLISAWQSQVAAGNYGIFVTKRDYFQGLAVRGHFLLIIQNDGTGWMREHFDSEWFLLPEIEKPRVYELWNPSVHDVQLNIRLRDVKASLLQRTIAPSIRETEAPRWTGGSEEELSALLGAAVRLFLASGDFEMGSPVIGFKSHSSFAKGDIESDWLKNACRNAEFGAVWQIIEREFHFAGVRWSEGGERVDLYPRQRNEKIFQAGIEEFGPDWRGNWAPQRASFALSIPNLSPVGESERLESQVLLRAWLRDKMPNAQIETLLQGV